MPRRPPNQASKGAISSKMGPTRGRPPKVETEKLLQVARDVFLEYGIQASTLEVAKRAGVSEGTLFHRFKTKNALFGQAMQLTEDEIPRQVLEAIASVEDLELEDMLQQLGTAFLDIGRVGVPLMMMSWANPACGDANDRNVKIFRLAMKRMASILEDKMAKNRMRKVDSEIVARTFVGALYHYCMSRVMEPAATWIVPESIFVRGLVDLVLRGVEAPAASRLPA